tara:strand:- start:22699 stop:24114 length:1416 start_codon:yes stop_codon:yes gene_type:complete
MKIVRYIILTTLLSIVCVINSSAEITYDKIQLLIENDKHKEALNLTEDYLSRNKSDIKFQFLKGLILARLNRYNDAEKIFYKMAEENPNLPEPLNNLAVIYSIQGEYSKAQEILKKALESNRNYETVYHNLSDLYAKVASRAYNQALGISQTERGPVEKLLFLRELNLPQTMLIESLNRENKELKSVMKDTEKVLEENKLAIKIKNQELSKLGEAQRSIQKLMQEKLELNIEIKELKGSLDEVMYSLSLKDEQLAKLDETEKALAGLTNENKGLKDRLVKAEASLGQLSSSLILKDEQLAKLDENLNNINAADLKKENSNLKSKVNETELLLEELKKSVADGAEDPSPDIGQKTNKLSEQKKAIEIAINNWVNAWASKNIDNYISSYAMEFKPSRGLSRAKWELQRRERLANPSFIKIKLTNIKIEIRDDGLANVRFTQQYQSDSYKDEVKKIVTVKMINNKWLIMRERVL